LADMLMLQMIPTKTKTLLISIHFVEGSLKSWNKLNTLEINILKKRLLIAKLLK